MKIDKASSPLPANPANEARTANAANSGGASPKSQLPVAETNVSLGSTATQLRSMQEGLASTPTTNAAKVDEIKQAISEGRFKINSEVVADHLIATVRELIQSRA